MKKDAREEDHYSVLIINLFRAEFGLVVLLALLNHREEVAPERIGANF